MVGRWRKKRRKGSILETAGGLICWLMSWQARITEGLDACQTSLKRAGVIWDGIPLEAPVIPANHTSARASPTVGCILVLCPI